MPLSDRERDLLANDLLTWIEQREAEQIAYGVYDVTMIGAEVIVPVAFHLHHLWLSLTPSVDFHLHWCNFAGNRSVSG